MARRTFWVGKTPVRAHRARGAGGAAGERCGGGLNAPEKPSG